MERRHSGGSPKLTYKDRVVIEKRYCIDKYSIVSIAQEIGRHRSSVSREINGKPRIGRGKYSSDRAQRTVDGNRKHQGRRKKLEHPDLYAYVRSSLQIGWSPEQIQLRLPIEYPNNPEMRISYETIYQFVYAQIHRRGHGYVKPGYEDWRGYLTRRHKRRQKKGMRKVRKQEREAKLPSIEERPSEADEREIVGHWEDDTMVSKQSTARIKSVNERVSGMVFFGQTSDGSAAECDRGTINRLREVPPAYRRTLTRDRGPENIRYEDVETHTGISCFFAHPYCSQERGANENLNGLFRRYFPKGTDLATITPRQLKDVEYRLNTRPRKRLGGLTPYEVFYRMTGVAIIP